MFKKYYTIMKKIKIQKNDYYLAVMSGFPSEVFIVVTHMFNVYITISRVTYRLILWH